MAIEMRVDVQRRLAVGRVVGDFTLEQVIAAIGSCVKHPDFEPGFNVLSDHTAVRTPLTKGQVEGVTGLLRALRSSLKGARWAVVTTKPASGGMINMLSVYAEDASVFVRVFDGGGGAQDDLVDRFAGEWVLQGTIAPGGGDPRHLRGVGARPPVPAFPARWRCRRSKAGLDRHSAACP